jgi:two-component system heavy metal sensor histidine kinase CusS
MKPARLSLRLALSGGALGALLVCALVAFFYVALTQQLDNQTRDHLSNKLQQVLHAVSEEPDSEGTRQNSHRIAEYLIGHDELHIAIASPSGDLIASFSDVGKESLNRVNRSSGTPYTDWHLNGARLLSVVGEGKSKNGESSLAIVTVDRRNDDRLQSYFLRLSLFALPIALALVVIGAWWIAYNGLKPLRRLRQATASVTTHDLSYRLTTNDLPIELRELADSFNRMLERLDEGVSRLFQFSGDLAHEMRTPISNLLGKTQVTLSKTRPADEYRSVLESNVEELERLSRLVDDMLFLTQVDHAVAALRLEPVNLNEEITRTADFFGTVAAEDDIAIRIHGRGTVEADRLMVQRAISNLLSNAIRHTPKGETVSVHIERKQDRTTVTVSNPGEHIAAEHLPHLFERFYRVDPGRSRSQGGTGLGLAIVNSIMKLHGGHVSVESASGGKTSFHLTFPT